jgi:flagellar basal body rod protein FlgC
MLELSHGESDDPVRTSAVASTNLKAKHRSFRRKRGAFKNLLLAATTLLESKVVIVSFDAKDNASIEIENNEDNPLSIVIGFVRVP